MPQYRVLIERVRTVTEYQTVTVTSSSAVYAAKDAEIMADEDDWIQESTTSVYEVQHIKGLGLKKSPTPPAKFDRVDD